MKRWNVPDMRDLGRKLFARIHRQKHHAHANHEVHFMARQLNRCKRHMIAVLKERRLSLSRKKTSAIRSAVSELPFLSNSTQHIGIAVP